MPSRTHPSYQRLQEVVHEIRGANRPGDIARALGETVQVVANWRGRGVSKFGVLRAAEVFGVNPRYLMDGKRPIFGSNVPVVEASSNAAAQPPLDAASLVTGLAQLLDAMDDAARRDVGVLLATLVLAPDSPKLQTALASALAGARPHVPAPH